MKTAIIGDLHIGARGGSSGARDFITSYLMGYFFPKLKELGINTYIQSGDAFDVRKYIHGLDMAFLLDEFVMVHLTDGLTGHYITGNHDITLRDSNKVAWTKMLEAIGAGCIFSYTECEDVSINDDKFLMLPWINKENFESTIQHISRTDSKFAIAHIELSGFPMYRNSVSDEGQVELQTLAKFDKVISGHYHTISQSSNITYVGSPYHLTWQDYPDERGFWVFDHDTKELEFIKNPDNLSMFRIFEYSWAACEADPQLKAKLKEVVCLENDFGFKDSIVKVVVSDRGDVKHYNEFCNALRRARTIDYTVVDKTVTKQSVSSGEGLEGDESNPTVMTEETLRTDIIEVLNQRIINTDSNINKDLTLKMMGEIHETALNVEKM